MLGISLIRSVLFALIFGLLLFSGHLFCIDFHDFDPLQNVLTKEMVEKKIKTYLEKDPQIKRFYQITPEALYIGDFASQQTDYVLHLTTDAHSMKSKGKCKPKLKNAKIAIDPGHFGGAYAALEERYISIPREKAKGDGPFNFNEGTLTYLTAVALKSLLEAEGAKVLITRPGIGQGAIRENFFEWVQQYPLLWKNEETLRNLFRNYYNRADLYARAEAINAFAPDLTIIIHYNWHLSEFEKEQGALLTQTNYTLAFIPGAFCANELCQAEDRYEFLRMIVSDDLEESLELARCILPQFVDQLDVPSLCNEKRSSAHPSCLLQEMGIYSRNLALTRLVHSPLCYGESLVQNNEKEVSRLSTYDMEIAGQSCPKRVKEVASAYFHGIKNYLEGASSNTKEENQKTENLKLSCHLSCN